MKPTARRELAGDQRLAGALAGHGVAPGGPYDGLIFDASALEPSGWDDVEAILMAVFEHTKAAVSNRAPLTYVLDEPSLFGHGDVHRCVVNTALLGGARSAAVEGQRDGIPANVVAVGRDAESDETGRVVAWIATQTALTGQVITCGTAHVGRPAP